MLKTTRCHRKFCESVGDAHLPEVPEPLLPQERLIQKYGNENPTVSGSPDSLWARDC
jgi:hypothetical protein